MVGGSGAHQSSDSIRRIRRLQLSKLCRNGSINKHYLILFILTHGFINKYTSVKPQFYNMLNYHITFVHLDRFPWCSKK